MKKIYIGCALTHAPQEYKDMIDSLKRILREKYEILDFIGLVNGTAQDVYKWDTNCVKTCDYFIAECTYPSIGLGAELGTALEIGKPVLAVAHESAKVTRYVLGVTKPDYTFARYKELQDLVDIIHQKLQDN